VSDSYRDPDSPNFFRGDTTFVGPKLLRLLEREGFHHAPRDGAPLFPGNALQSHTGGGSLVLNYYYGPQALERPTAIRPGAVSRRSPGAARILPTPSAVSGLGPLQSRPRIRPISKPVPRTRLLTSSGRSDAVRVTRPAGIHA
jgi:hypothetical protein